MLRDQRIRLHPLLLAGWLLGGLLLTGCGGNNESVNFKDLPLSTLSLPPGAEILKQEQFHEKRNAPRRQWLLTFNYSDSWTDIWNHVEHGLAADEFREMIFDTEDGREKREWHRVYYSPSGLVEVVLSHSMDAKIVGLRDLEAMYFVLITEYSEKPDVLSFVGAESQSGGSIKLQELK